MYSQVLRELSFNFDEYNVLSGLASRAPLGAAAGTVMRSLSARCKGGQMGAPAGWLQQVMKCAPAGSRRCVADRSPVAWQARSAKVSWYRIPYCLLCRDRLVSLDASSSSSSSSSSLLEVCQGDYSFRMTPVPSQAKPSQSSHWRRRLARSASRRPPFC